MKYKTSFNFHLVAMAALFIAINSTGFELTYKGNGLNSLSLGYCFGWSYGFAPFNSPGYSKEHKRIHLITPGFIIAFVQPKPELGLSLKYEYVFNPSILQYALLFNYIACMASVEGYKIRSEDKLLVNYSVGIGPSFLSLLTFYFGVNFNNYNSELYKNTPVFFALSFKIPQIIN